MSARSNLSPEMRHILKISHMTTTHAQNLKTRAATQMKCYLTGMVIRLDLDKQGAMTVQHTNQTQINTFLNSLQQHVHS